MTALLEKLVAIIAPFDCILCSKEDNVICLPCLADVFPGVDSVCVLCSQPSEHFAVCRACRQTTDLERVWVAAEYSGVPAELISRFKFERLKAAYVPLAASLDGVLSFIPFNTQIVPVPTATGRVRQRGYDQTVLLAKELARLRKLPYSAPLLRMAHARQLGASRKARQVQAGEMFRVKSDVENKNILLIDDVCTTGATLRAATKVLKEAGAANVQAAVVAWAVPKAE